MRLAAAVRHTKKKSEQEMEDRKLQGRNMDKSFHHDDFSAQ